MKEKNKKSSPVWLVIILAAIIFLLQNIISSIKHNQQLMSLKQELEVVSLKAVELEKQKEEALQALEQKLSTASAVPLINSEATFGSQPNMEFKQFEPQISSFSGESL